MSLATRSIQDRPTEPLLILFRIISRYSWDELQRQHEALPGSRIEHVMEGTGIFVLIVEPCGVRRLSA